MSEIELGNKINAEGAGLARIRDGGVQPEGRRPGKVLRVTLGVVAESHRAMLFADEPNGEALIEVLSGRTRGICRLQMTQGNDK